MLKQILKVPLNKNNYISYILRGNYHANVVDHYENPRNVGSLDKNKKK